MRGQRCCTFAVKTEVGYAVEYSKFERLSSATKLELQQVGIATPWDPWSMYDGFLSTEVLPFLKFYDLSRADDDAENFYMEREWRVVGAVQFKVDDIERVFLPRKFSRAWRERFPAYSGQLAFV